MSLKNRFFNKQMAVNKGVLDENTNGSLLDQGRLMKGQKNEEDN